MSLADKNALITGGGTGIGLGIARALAGNGCRVAIAGRRGDVLRDAAASWTGEPPLRHHRVDVADRDSVAGLFDWFYSEFEGLDILVLSAGVNIPNRKMTEMQPEQWDQVLSVNATGAYNCMHAALPGMRERGDAIVVNISSIAGKRASALGGVAYSASKFAMTALGACVANELAPAGIRITNVYPGEVNTPILDHRPVPVSEEHRSSILQPDDVGTLVATICALPPRAHVPEVIIKPLRQEYA